MCNEHSMFSLGNHVEVYNKFLNIVSTNIKILFRDEIVFLNHLADDVHYANFFYRYLNIIMF